MLDGIVPGQVIGVDEAGRGPVLGPLVVAGVISDDQEVLRGWGVRDSKMLSPGRRDELAERIRGACDVEIVGISAATIDSLRKTMTLNEIEVDAFHQAITGILGRNRSENDENQKKPPTIILDAADVKEDRFGTDIHGKLMTSFGANYSIPPIISKHRADDIFPVVSAASIIAKTHRDEVIEALKTEYGDIGSGYPSDPKTKKYLIWLFKSGKPTPPFVRQSWETVKRLKRDASTTKLEDFF